MDDLAALRKYIERYYMKTTVDETPTGAFLQMHLILERQVRMLIAAQLSKPERFTKAKMKLSALADLATAMGLLTEQFADTLIWLDKQRNALAHDLAFQITPSTTQALREQIGLQSSLFAPDVDWKQELYALLGSLQQILEKLISSDPMPEP